MDMIGKHLQFNKDTVLVYVAKFDSSLEVQPVRPASRNEAIQRCTDLLTRQQRYAVWRLLDYALKQHCGKGVDGFDFTVGADGKWSCNGTQFSLSHCNNVVVVAISAQSVGVDIEAVSSFDGRANDEAFVSRILNDTELKQLELCEPSRRNQALALLWTGKESAFKLESGAFFSPRSIDTTKRLLNSRLLDIDGNEYALSVATETKTTVEVRILR